MGFAPLFGEAAPAWEIRGTAGAAGRLEALVLKASEARAEALRMAAKRWGLRETGNAIRWVLDLEGLPARPGGSVEAGAVRVVEGGVEVRIFARRYLARPWKIRAPVAHECAHALLLADLGFARYRKLPYWFREGMALAFAGEGEARVEAALAEALLSRAGGPGKGDGGEPRSEVSTRSSKTSTARRAAEAFLAYRALEERLGAAGVGRLIAQLRRGAGWRESASSGWIFEKVEAGETPSDFAARELAALAVSPAARRLQEALRRIERGRIDPARVLLEDRRAFGPLAGTARYYRAQVLMRAGNVNEARRELEALLQAQVEGPWEEYALRRLLDDARRRGDRRRAEALERELRERFPPLR